MPEFLLWPEAFEGGIVRCGGKGWNLARLHRYGFEVPAGGVLTVEGYTQVLDSGPIAALVRSLRGVAAEETMRPEVAAALEDMHSRIESFAWSAEFVAALAGFLHKLNCENTPMAVRSSATAEDGLKASFAGMHRSFLNIEGTDCIARAILGCYASLWTPQALAYRRRLELGDDEVSCAVVICAMVAQPGSRAPAGGGVTFTCDPTTGRRDLIVINAARGSGEAVVGGEVQPEQIVVRREKRGKYFLESPGESPNPVLAAEQALRLARLAVRIQWALGDGQDPQDIEWVLAAGDRFWILQARPVTSLPTFTFPEVKTQPVIWSTANIKEAVSGVFSMLSWSLIQDVVGDVLYASLSAAGYKIPAGLEVVRRFGGRGYFDLTGMQWAFYDALGILPSQAVAAIGGHQPEIVVPPGNPLRGKLGRRRSRARLRLAKRLWGLHRELDVEIRKSLQAVRHLVPDDLPSMPKPDLMRILERIAEIFDGIGFRAGLANSSTGGWQDMLDSQLHRIAGNRNRALMTRLLAGFGNVTSAEQGYRTHALAAAAREDPVAQAWLQAQNPAGEWRTLPADSAFRKALERFLEDFGHRAVVEGDIMNARWAEDPSYILDQVRILLKSGAEADPAAKARALRAEAEKEMRSMTFWRRPLIRWLVNHLQQGLALREAAKSAMNATALPSRKVLLEIGRRLAEAGNLAQASDIFHMAVAEIQCYLSGEWDGRGARTLTADRIAQRGRWLDESPPDVIIAGAPPAALQGDRRIVSTGDQKRWSGIGVAAGQAQGLCRILRHPHEGDRLQRGEILIAPSTDPGWTPLFLRAAAIVMETGGFLSHGAIVAREYGIPAVVNIPNILEQVQDGAQLLVNGDNGTVETM